jgi:cation transport regulator ChaB
MVEFDRRRHAPALPVIDPLNYALLALDAKQLGEGGVAAGGVNEIFGLLRSHDGPHIKHSVYSKSNILCNKALNAAFTISAVPKDKQQKRPNTLSIRTALRLAMDRHHWNQSEFARELALASGKGIKPQDVTNWKKRGMPAEHLEVVSQVLHCSVDELLGRMDAASAPRRADPWPFNFPRQLYEQLDKDERVIFAYESRKTIADIIAQRSDAGKQESDI